MSSRSVLPIALALFLPTAVAGAGDWTEFRGPGQQGHSDEQGLPLTWSPTEHVVWKADIPGLGWSYSCNGTSPAKHVVHLCLHCPPAQ